ncbi:conjugal transfer protein TraD [Salmonella enterica subsp. houtenae serovar 51:z4,z23:-]|nr:conjugal transfer protein TraD [Salmonella enterica subsp. houtenae serovar 51:z4,z23:-]
MTDNNAVNNDVSIPPRSGMDGAVNDKFLDLAIPGYLAEFSPEEADLAGAFSEDALSEQDALASVSDEQE